MTASIEDRVQVGLMLAVGSAAAAYSWSHVLDLATLHGQVGWRAWVVALVTESAAVSGGLEVRRRRRAGEPARWALAALGAAVVLQVAAQVAMAEASAWGVVLAVVPAVVFLLLVKIALSRMPEPVRVAKPRRRVATSPVTVATSVATPATPPPVVGAATPGHPQESLGHPALAIVATPLATGDDPVATYLANPGQMTYGQLATLLGCSTDAARSRVRNRRRQEAKAS